MYFSGYTNVSFDDLRVEGSIELRGGRVSLASETGLDLASHQPPNGETMRRKLFFLHHQHLDDHCHQYHQHHHNLYKHQYYQRYHKNVSTNHHHHHHYHHINLHHHYLHPTTIACHGFPNQPHVHHQKCGTAHSPLVRNSTSLSNY